MCWLSTDRHVYRYGGMVLFLFSILLLLLLLFPLLFLLLLLSFLFLSLPPLFLPLFTPFYLANFHFRSSFPYFYSRLNIPFCRLIHTYRYMQTNIAQNILTKADAVDRRRNGFAAGRRMQPHAVSCAFSLPISTSSPRAAKKWVEGSCAFRLRCAMC